MHEFHKYGYTEFGKQIYKMRSTWFRYYFAQQAGEVLQAIKPNEESKTIDENLTGRLNDFKKDFQELNKKMYIPESEEEDYFGFKFFKTSYPEKEDDAEILVHQYLSFMAIIESENREQLVDIHGEKTPYEQLKHQELNDTKRREIFEYFIELKGKKNYPCDRYEVDKQNFKNELWDLYGVNQVHFDSVCAMYIENDKQFSEKDQNEVKKTVEVIKNLKKIKNHHNLCSQVFISICDRFLKEPKVVDSRNSTNSYSKVYTRIQRAIDEFEKDSDLHIAVGNDKVVLKTHKVISNMLKVFYTNYHEYQAKFSIEEIFSDEMFLDYLLRTEKNQEKPNYLFRVHALIEKLLQIQYTAPYVVKLIAENASDDVVEKKHFVRLLEILLEQPEGSYIQHLDVLLSNFKSVKIDLYHEICEIICTQNIIDIKNMSLIFSKPKHVRVFLLTLEKRIQDLGCTVEGNTVKLTKSVLNLLNETSYELYKDGSYDEALEILEDSLALYKKLLRGSLIKENETQFLIARYRRARIKNQLAMMKEEDSDREGFCKEAHDAFQEIRNILLEDLSSDSVTEVKEPDKITLDFLTLSEIAYTDQLLGKYTDSCKEYESLFKEVVSFVLNSQVTSLSPETYTAMLMSQKYQDILSFSSESKKYLDILRIKNSVAYNKVCYGEVCYREKNTSRAESLYKSAFKIYREVYCYRKETPGISNKFLTQSLRHIADISGKIGRLLSENRIEGCNQRALYWYYFTLLCNNVVYKMQDEMYWPSHPAVVLCKRRIIYCICDVAYVHNNIGYYKTSPEERKRYHEKALSMYQDTFGVMPIGAEEKEHKTVCKIKRGISYTKKRLGHDITERKTILEEVIEIQEDKLGPDHTDTKKTKEMLQKLISLQQS